MSARRPRGLTAAERAQLAGLVDRLAATLAAADWNDPMEAAITLGGVRGTLVVLAKALRQDSAFYPLSRRLAHLAGDSLAAGGARR